MVEAVKMSVLMKAGRNRGIAHSVAMFPVFAGAAHSNMTVETKSLLLQFFSQFVSSGTCLFKFQIIFPVIAAAVSVRTVEGVNVFPLRTGDSRRQPKPTSPEPTTRQQ